MKCPYCGFSNEADAKYCQQCGSRLTTSQGTSNSSQQEPNAWTASSKSPLNDSHFMIDGKDYTPLSMWSYFGFQILFAIPIVGFICLCICSFGGTRKINLRNFARSYFCVAIIAIVSFFILSTLGLSLRMLA